MYTLQDFFTAAGLINPVPFAPFITMEKEPWASQVKNLNRLLTHEMCIRDRFSLQCHYNYLLRLYWLYLLQEHQMHS